MKSKSAVLLVSTLVNVGIVAAFAVRPSLAPAGFREVFHFGDGAREPLAAPGPAPRRAAPVKLWTTIATQDLATLAARFRALGFPADVIRHIIGLEVQARYSARLRALTEPDPNTPFWKTPSTVFVSGSPRMEEYAQIQRERSKLLRELFADPFYATDDVTTAQSRQFGNLPRAKVDALQRIEDDYAEMTSAVRAGTNGITLPADREKLALLEREKLADLAAVLSPEELAEYRVRSSPITRMLGDRLGEFHASEAEFRALFAQQKAMNDRFPTSDSGMMTANYNERRAAQKELEGQLRASLGEARYADYIRETSDDFQQLRRMAQRDNIPIEVATRAFDLRTGVAADSVRIINDSVMTVDQKREAMAALAQGTRTQLLGLLGSTTGPAYIKLVDSAWLNNIERGIAIEFTGGPRSTMSSGGVTVGVGTSAAAVRGLPMVRPTP